MNEDARAEIASTLVNIAIQYYENGVSKYNRYDFGMIALYARDAHDLVLLAGAVRSGFKLNIKRYMHELSSVRDEIPPKIWCDLRRYLGDFAHGLRVDIGV